MMLFWLLAVLFVVVTLIVCLRSLRQTQASKVNLPDDGADELQQRLAELETDLENGVITQQEAENSRKEIQLAYLNRRVPTAPASTAATKSFNRMTALFLVAFVPVFVALFYNYLGRPDLISGIPEQPAQDRPVTPEQIEEMVAGLEQRLQENPEDSQGWQMLYRSYMVLEQYDKALMAAEQLFELEGEKPDVLLRYVDALAMANDQKLAGKPTEVINRILEIEPDNASALWLAGMAANERADYAQALEYWEGLLPRIEDGTEPKKQLQQMIAFARQKMDGDVPENMDPETVTITVNVYLAPELKDSINQEATLFVYARSQDEESIPVALVKQPIAEFPMQLTLDNGDVMSPSIQLADFNQVQLIARISASGQSQPEDGDLIGAVSNISPFVNSPVDLIIRDKIQL